MNNREEEQERKIPTIMASFASFLPSLPGYHVQSFITKMVSSANEAKEKVMNYPFRSNLQSYMLGDLGHRNIFSLLRHRASEDKKNGIGIAHIGPPKIGMNIALMTQQAGDAQHAEKQLDTVLNLSEESSRVPYEILNLISGSSFLLADSSVNALDTHKELSRYLKPQEILNEFKQNISILLAQERPKDTNLQDVEKLIQPIVTQSFAKVLFGVETTPKLNVIINSLLEQLSLNSVILPLLIQRYFPKKLTYLKDRYLSSLLEKYFPDIAQTRKAVDLACREFFKEKANDLQALIHAEKSNLLVDKIKDVLTKIRLGNDLTQLNDIQLNTLADHPEIRNALFSLFAIDNAAHTISYTATSTLHLLSDKRVVALGEALDQQKEPDDAKLPKVHRETLEAIYNYGLLKHSKFSELLRYTKEGIHTPEIDIPANTFILCNVAGERHKSDNLNHMYVGRNFACMYHDNYYLPSKDTLEKIRQEHCTIDKETQPLLIKVLNSRFYLYGKINNTEWGLTELGHIASMKTEARKWDRNGCIGYYRAGGHKELYDIIAAKKAHLPFQEPERLKYTLGEGRLTLFGRGARRCPAAARVGALSKYLIMTIIKYYKRSISEELVMPTAMLETPGKRHS